MGFKPTEFYLHKKKKVISVVRNEDEDPTDLINRSWAPKEICTNSSICLLLHNRF